MRLQEALTFDDIQLGPQFSDITSRSDIDISTNISHIRLSKPLIASPMDTICEAEMAITLGRLGGMGIIHRFMTPEQQATEVNLALDCGVNVCAAIGISEKTNNNYKERLNTLMNKTQSELKIINIDVAHGHCLAMKNAIEWITKHYPNLHIMAGNIATKEAAKDLVNWGASSLRVGIGNGCFTPDMRVITAEGEKPISEVIPGNKVITHVGDTQEVINVFEEERDEEIIVINDKIKCTINHEFYVVRTCDINKINEHNIDLYTLWIAAEDLSDEYMLVKAINE